jgi:uncharacterized protein involved in exopolysaccharide biosynthesis
VPVTDSFESFDFPNYLKRKWRYCVLACAVAVALALVGSLLLPKQYSSTATLLIEPPQVADLRVMATASSVYLESLKAYEHVASGNKLFQRAVQKFDLRSSYPGEPLETIKRRTLNVSKIRETRVLEITVTLPDARKAAAVAEYLAQQVAEMTQPVGRDPATDTPIQQEPLEPTAGERLHVIDSGVVPERPSSPNLPLNLVAAFALAAVASSLYLVVGFSIERHGRTFGPAPQAAEHARRI